MEFLRQQDIPRARVLRTFRYGRVAHLVMLVLFAGGPIWGLRLAWPTMREMSLLGWLAATPVLVFVPLIYLLVNSAIARAAVASFLPSNWILRTEPDGLFIKFRSYQNHHFGGDGPVVCHVRFAEIDAAGKVVERKEEHRNDGRRVAYTPYLELRLKELDTEALARALAEERTRKAPEERFLGIRSRTKSNHVPVLVPEPGVVRLDYRRGMLKALERFVEIAPKRTVDVGPKVRVGKVTEDEILELIERGDKIAAVSLVRDTYGMGLKEAKGFVEGAGLETSSQ